MSKSEEMMKKLEENLPVPPPPPGQDDIKDDYEFSRETYRNLVSKSNEAIEQMLNLAMQSEHPRAFEVLSNMLKNTSDMTDKLMALQKAKKEIQKKEETAESKPALTQNNLFLGSTTDLQKHLIAQLKEQNVSASEPDVRQER
jgi:hypothetical protein